MLIQCLQTTAHYFAQYFRRHALLGETGDRHCGQGSARHRPHIVDGIEGGDLTVDKRIVNYRGKEIEGLHDSEVVAKAKYSSVVGSIKTDNQVFVKRLFR